MAQGPQFAWQGKGPGRKHHLHFNIFTATLVTRLGLSLSRPMASASTTCPKQPSPRGLPRTSLWEKKGGVRWGWGSSNPRTPHHCFSVFHPAGWKLLLDAPGAPSLPRRSPYTQLPPSELQAGDLPHKLRELPVSRQLPARVFGKLIFRDPSQHGGSAGGEA